MVVSFRDRRTNYRVARDGFYHVDPAEADPCRDLVLATIKTLRSSNGNVEAYGLDRLKLGVTLYGRHVPASLRQLDFSRFGILVRSTAQPWKLAGALPNTQFFVSEIEQLRHARFTNTKLFLLEPHKLFLHTVNKSVETGCDWPSFGTSEKPEGTEYDDHVGALLTGRSRAVLESIMSGREAKSDGSLNSAVPGRVDGVVVSLYHRGMIGCWDACKLGLIQIWTI